MGIIGLDSNAWIIGVGMSIVGSVTSNIGVNVQKYSQNKNRSLPSTLRKNYYCQPLWHFGLGLVFTGSVLDFFALSFAAQSIVAPIGAVALVANMVFASLFLNEKLSKLDFVATILIITGATLAVFFGDHSDHPITIQILKGYFTEPAFFIYAGICTLIVINLYGYLFFLTPMKKKLDDAIDQLSLLTNGISTDCLEYGSTTSGYNPQLVQLGFPTTGVQPDIIELEKRYKKHAPFHPFLYCCISGLLGAQSVLCAKSIAEMFRETVLTDTNQFKHWLPPILLVLTVAFIFSQLHFLALGLQHFDALYVVPVFQCFFILCSTIGGAAFYQEFNSFTFIQSIMFPIGASITLFGVYLLSRHKMATKASATALLPRLFSSPEFLPLYREAASMIKQSPWPQYLKSDIGRLKTGAHEVCFENDTKKRGTKIVSFNIYVESRDRALIHQQYSSTGLENLTPLERGVIEMNQGLRSVEDAQRFQKIRERDARNTNDSTNTRVFWWGIFEAVTLMLVAAWQLLTLRNFFETKRAI